MSAVVPPAEQRFLSNLLTCLQNVHFIVKRLHDNKQTDIDPNLMETAINLTSVVGKSSPHLPIQTYIKRTRNAWKEVKDKNRHFFLSSADKLFEDIPSHHIDAFSKLFQEDPETKSHAISKEDEESLWSQFLPLTKISIRYCEDNPIFSQENGIDIKSMLNLFDMKPMK